MNWVERWGSPSHGIPDAERELTEIWLAATDRDAVTNAVASIESELSASPLATGEEFYGDRLLLAEPIAVVFLTRSEDLLVQVLQVWHQ